MKFLGRRQATTSELDKRSPERQKAPRKHEFPGAFSSRADWIRTSDLYTPSVARYQTTLQPVRCAL